MPAVTSLDGQRIGTGKTLDMADLGIGGGDEDEALDYDMGNEVFYDDEIKDAVRIRTTNTQVGNSVKREQTEYERLIQ